jgi:hypothetical protein
MQKLGQTFHIKKKKQTSKQTSVPILKRKDGSASILFRSIAHDLIANPKSPPAP